MTWRTALLLCFALLVTGLAFGAPAARAEDYVIGPDDVLAISVWLHPELERTVTVSASGTITFPPVGEVSAAGLTPKQLGDRIGDKVTAYLRQAATVNVTVRDFLSHSVYVSGGVSKPGRYGFEHIPSVVDVISQAGGALPGADLSRVQVVRQDGDQRHTMVADVASVLRDGSVQNLPKLRAGDTVIVPGGSANAPGAPVGDGVAVLGEVARPGVYSATGGQDLWNMLASAGGITARGNLKDVHVITHDTGSKAVFEVNLQDALKRGSRGSYVVQAGDVVFVPARGGANGYSVLSTTLSLAVAALNVAVLVDVLKRGGRY
ncbi:MAG TPA: polysaccharide biosynthesis/export family protein [Candidatus Udaeobacter sp.]|jgi:polysaccharide export outer membrane protein|nr:polysaccharide biosynthesis/export family protein [Candidatus Udaeobacter sp.]